MHTGGRKKSQMILTRRNNRQTMTFMGTVTGQGRVWSLCVRDSGLLADVKHCKPSLKCNFMTQKVNAILGIINKSIISKMHSTKLPNTFKNLFVLPMITESRQHCLADFEISQT